MRRDWHGRKASCRDTGFCGIAAGRICLCGQDSLHISPGRKRQAILSQPSPTIWQEVVKTAHQSSGRRVVILVDEYDKPLIESMEITIRSFDRRKSGYILCFPNQEVRYGFLDSLLPAYVPKMSNLAGTDIFSLDETGIRE